MAIEPTLSTTALDQSEESSTLALYRAAIGPVSTDYYAKVFSRFEAADRSGIRWNWAAALNSLNWFAFRQLWTAVLAYGSSVVGLALLVFGIGRLVFQFSDAMEMAALVVLIAIAVVVPGLYGNALLYAECRKKMEKALASNTTLPEACAVLTRQAPGHKRLLAIAGVNMGLIALVIAAYFNVPQPGQILANVVTASQSSSTATKAATHSSAPTSAPASTPAVAVASAPKAAASGLVPPAAAPVASAPATPVTATSAPGRSAAGTIQLEPPAKRVEPAASAAASAPVPRVSAGPARPVVAPKPPATTPKPVASTPSATTATVAPKEGTAASLTMAPGFYINVGLFAEDANARKAHTKLVDAGLNAFVQDVKYPRGLRHRVRVGPFETQAQADTAADKIHSLDLEAVVFQQ